MMEQDELTPEEKAAFDALASHQMPPAALEERVVNELIAEELIDKSNSMKTYIKYLTGIAASVLLFFAGNYVGSQNQNEGLVAINPSDGYIMILKEDARFTPGDPMEMFEEYAAWMNNLFEEGVKITGQELKDSGWQVTQAKTDLLSTEDELRVTGYFLIEANSEEEALAVVKDNPHIKYGGIVELKPFLHRQ